MKQAERDLAVFWHVFCTFKEILSFLADCFLAFHYML